MARIPGPAIDAAEPTSRIAGAAHRERRAWAPSLKWPAFWSAWRRLPLYVQLGARRKVKPQAPVVCGGRFRCHAPPHREKTERPCRARLPGRSPNLPPAPKEIDRAAVAQAEAELDAASRDRARADDRAAASAQASQPGRPARRPLTRRGRASWLSWCATRRRESPRRRPEAGSCGASAKDPEGALDPAAAPAAQVGLDPEQGAGRQARARATSITSSCAGTASRSSIWTG